MTDLNTIKEFTEALRATETGTKPYDTTAEVIRTDGQTAWVHIPGGVDETPVQMSIDAKAGDSVNVRVSGGRAWITGNSSRPPTDDTVAHKANTTATEAQAVAEEAQETAEEASQIAQATKNYFWHDAAGAHVSTVEGDATTGNNVLIDSDSIAIRDGETELASFDSDEIKLGQDTAVISMCDGFGTIREVDSMLGVLGRGLSIALNQDASDANTDTILMVNSYGEELTGDGAKLILNSRINNVGTLGLSEAALFGSNSIQVRCSPHYIPQSPSEPVAMVDLRQSIDISTLERFSSITISADKIVINANTVDSNCLMPVISTSITTDLNDATEAGFYTFSSTANNKPSTAGGSLITMVAASPYVHQIAFPNNNQGTATAYTRLKYSGGWGAWVKL